mmetsp:Transcript_30208/g.64002  ORF Transcript_30208/g.64002 Transcript_30208/m.64002 type:complete len:214 (+) Transcript_30208:2113-2754(+)
MGIPSMSTANTRARLGTTIASGFKCRVQASRIDGRTPSPRRPDSRSSDVQISAISLLIVVPPLSFSTPFLMLASMAPWVLGRLFVSFPRKRASSIPKVKSVECCSTILIFSDRPFSSIVIRARRAMADAISTDVTCTLLLSCLFPSCCSDDIARSCTASRACLAFIMASRPVPDPISRMRMEPVVVPSSFLSLLLLLVELSSLLYSPARLLTI